MPMQENQTTRVVMLVDIRTAIILIKLKYLKEEILVYTERLQ